MSPEDSIIFPLDGMELAEAIHWIQQLYGRVGMMKVGLELFSRSGPKAVDHVVRENVSVMYLGRSQGAGARCMAQGGNGAVH